LAKLEKSMCAKPSRGCHHYLWWAAKLLCSAISWNLRNWNWPSWQNWKNQCVQNQVTMLLDVHLNEVYLFVHDLSLCIQNFSLFFFSLRARSMRIMVNLNILPSTLFHSLLFLFCYSLNSNLISYLYQTLNIQLELSFFRLPKTLTPYDLTLFSYTLYY
jgi:hypothetical protein